MNVTHPIADKVLARLRSAQGAAVPAAELRDLGERAAIDQALSRLTRQGAIRRVRRGLYELPRIGKLLERTHRAVARRTRSRMGQKNGLRVLPSGAHAANLLGLSTQVPAKLVYYTNGRTRTLNSVPTPSNF